MKKHHAEEYNRAHDKERDVQEMGPSCCSSVDPGEQLADGTHDIPAFAEETSNSGEEADGTADQTSQFSFSFQSDPIEDVGDLEGVANEEVHFFSSKYYL